MLFRPDWSIASADNHAVFCLYMDNLEVSDTSLPGIVTHFSFDYVNRANDKLIFDGGYVYFTHRRDDPERFNSLDEFYDLIRTRATPGAYDSRITIRKLKSYAFYNCKDVGLTPEILQGVFGEIEYRFNNVLFDSGKPPSVA